MKKLFSLIAAVFLIAGCDDGDIEFRTFDFTGETVSTCADNNIYFKINESEVLILAIDPETLINEVTLNEDGVEEPRIIAITPGGATTLTYRRYDSAITSSLLCANPVPASPGVVEEWIGDGSLSVTTKEIEEDGILLGYSHEITISSVTFTKDGVSETINNSEFGVIERRFDFSFDFEPANEETEREAIKCDSDDNNSNRLYTLKADEALTFDFEDGLFPTAPTTEPLLIDLDLLQNPDNRVNFRTFSGTVSPANVCSLDQPVSPITTARWQAIDGTIKIVTTSVAGALEHRIYFIDFIFQNGTEEINLNDIVAPVEGQEGYFYGVYYTAN